MSDSDINKNTKTPETLKSGNTAGRNPEPSKQTTSPIVRILAILGILVIVGLYVLSFVASISNWDNAFNIFTGALGASIFVPIVIYLIRLFSNKNKDN